MTGRTTPPSRRSRPSASFSHTFPPTGSAATRSKYGNKRTELDGFKFASKKEARRYGELRLLQTGKVIRDLKVQPVFPLIVNGERIGKYIGDFRYIEKDSFEVVEDVKGGNATKTAAWRLKWRMMKALYPWIDWRIV